MEPVQGRAEVGGNMQDPVDEHASDTQDKLDRAIDSAKQEVAVLRTEERALAGKRDALNTFVPIEEVERAVQSLQDEYAQLEARLASLLSGTGKAADPKEAEAVRTAEKRWASCRASRRRIRDDLWAALKDGLPDGMTEAELKVSIASPPARAILLRDCGMPCSGITKAR